MVASLALSLCACGKAPIEENEAPTEPVVQAPVEEVVTEAIVEGSLEDLDGVTYKVAVIDQNETAVSGVRIFLETEEGLMCDTDEMGVASFTLPAGQYSVSIVYMPDGYSYAEEARTFAFAENANHLTIVLYASSAEMEDDILDEGSIVDNDHVVDEIVEDEDVYVPEEE